jgi:hypothetical protein
MSGKPIERSGSSGSHHLLRRGLDQRKLEVEQERKLAKIALESGAEVSKLPTRATAAGDPRRVRGTPAVGPNVDGAIEGTRPGDGLE